MSTKTERFEFQAETKALLDIVIHSLYSNKEIFLRELISNSSDAIDRLRFEALSEDSLLAEGHEASIRLTVDTEQRQLHVLDDGIGMSRAEIIDNIGTIAKSGTKEVMNAISEAGGEISADLIGQFGVGFYSSFMVADKVEVLSRRSGEESATLWVSTGDGSYTIEDAERDGHGTTVTLHLKPVDTEAGLQDFTESSVLQAIVKRYSDFVAYPLKMAIEREELDYDDEGKPVEGSAKTVVADETLNSMKPIWLRPSDEVSEEEYAEFYHHISHDWQQPWPPLSLKAEGRIEYRALLFFPKQAPWDLHYREHKSGLQLYVRRVLILDHCEELLPPYLRWVRGVVDSSDLQLNVSREMIQQDRHIQLMRRWLTKKVLDHLKAWQKRDEDTYLELWGHFGRVLKEGLNADPDNRERLIPLLRFASTADPTKPTSLAAYVERMPEEQTEIYTITGESRASVEASPQLEALAAKGYEVLLLVDPVDEIVAGAIPEHDGKPLKPVGKGTVELGTEEEREAARKELEEQQVSHDGLLKTLQLRLDEWIKEVRLSTRLKTSPACLVSDEHDLSPQLERLLRQTEGSAGMPLKKRILELNPSHEILTKLQSRWDGDPNDTLIDDVAQLLMGTAYLAEGLELPDPVRYTQAVAKMVAGSL